MLRIATLVCSIAVVTAVSLEGQAKPDFSGRWVLVPERSVPANTWAMGKEFRASQTPSSIALELQWQELQLGPAGNKSTDVGFGKPIVYALDGADHEQPVAAPQEFSNRPGASRAYVRSLNYRATWTGDKLVIVSRDVFAIERPGETPKVARRVIRKALSLDADGSLVAESLIVADPFPGEQAQDAPVPIRSVYRKAS